MVGFWLKEVDLTGALSNNDYSALPTSSTAIVDVDNCVTTGWQKDYYRTFRGSAEQVLQDGCLSCRASNSVQALKWLN